MDSPVGLNAILNCTDLSSSTNARQWQGRDVDWAWRVTERGGDETMGVGATFLQPALVHGEQGEKSYCVSPQKNNNNKQNSTTQANSRSRGGGVQMPASLHNNK